VNTATTSGFATQPADDLPITGPYWVPKRTGTIGDTFIAWGLARFLEDLTRLRQVVIRDEGNGYRIDAPTVPLDATLPPGALSRLRFLAGKNKPAPAGVLSVDWDAIKEAREQARLIRGQGTEESPTSTESARDHPFFLCVTQPNPQWIGYNKLARQADLLATREGVRLVLMQFTRAPTSPTENGKQLRSLGIGVSDQRRNPHGFLFPGQNKAPTMRVLTGDSSVGTPTTPDWQMTDWEHLTVIELYLAYVGFFAAGRPLRGDGIRIIAVPEPVTVVVAPAFDVLREISGYAADSLAYMEAWAGLRYAQAALAYLSSVDLPGTNPDPRAVIRSVHLIRQWSPSGNTFATDRVGVASLPTWSTPILQSRGARSTAEMLALHERRLRALWGREDKERTAAARAAVEAYAHALSGDVGEWFAAVSGWFTVMRERDFPLTLWAWNEITEVATAMDRSVNETVRDPAFRAVADAIRQATVVAHYARERRKQSGAAPRNPFDPRYDLLGSLLEAAQRSKNEFIGQLYEFVATYNDETMRRNEDAGNYRRPLVRQEDLEAVQHTIEQDKRGVAMRALLAYGSSPKRREARAAEPESMETETVSESTDEE